MCFSKGLPPSPEYRKRYKGMVGVVIEYPPDPPYSMQGNTPVRPLVAAPPVRAHLNEVGRDYLLLKTAWLQLVENPDGT